MPPVIRSDTIRLLPESAVNDIGMPEAPVTPPDLPEPESETEISRKIVEGLRDLACDVLGRGIERMFDGADDMLFEMARRSSTNKDQRIYFDTMRVVRLGRSKIGRLFREEIAAGFSPQTQAEEPKTEHLTYEDLSLQESKSLEESIAVSSMATKAENLYSNQLFELGRRLDWMIQEKNAPLTRNALAPSTISAAFRRCAESMDVEFDIELIIFKLFDRLVISDLGELYTRALRFLDESGVKAAAISNPSRPYGGGGMGGGASGGVGATGAGDGPSAMQQRYNFEHPPMMDAATLNALRALSASGALAAAGGQASYYGPSDVQLSSELAMAASGQIVPGWEKPRAYAYVQRAGAVGQMFNELMQDPTLPTTLKPRFEQLRFSVIKSALHDSSFFADRQHPVRGLMNELTTLAASARASGMEALRRIEELVGQIQGQFDVAADEVRTQSALPAAVDEKTLEQFFEQQKEDARQRRLAIIERTRRVVAEELQLLTLNRRLPDSLWPLLNSGWAPLAALRLLKQGADSEAWREGMDLLKRILDSADPRQPAARNAEAMDRLDKEIRQRLAEIGMLDARIAVLVRAWRDSLAEIETAATTTTRPEGPSRADRLIAELLRAPAVNDARGTGTAAAAPDPAEAPADSEASAVVDRAAGDEALQNPDETAAAEAPEPFDEAMPAAEDSAEPAMVAPEPEPQPALPDPVALLDLLMVLSSWFRVYDHDRSQNRWLKVIGHNPLDGSVTFAEFNGQNRLQMRTQVFLDDLVAGRAEPIDLGPAARRGLDAYLNARRDSAEAAARSGA